MPPSHHPHHPHSLNSPASVRIDGWRAVAWVLVLLIAALLWHAWQARHADLMLAQAIFIGACTALLIFVRTLPSIMACSVVVAALLSGAGGAFEWFETIAWYDEAVHTYCGFAGLAAIGYLWAFRHPARASALIPACAVLGLALGIGWEVIEGLIGDLEFVDTATDLVFDTVGAALGGWWAAALIAREAALASR